MGLESAALLLPMISTLPNAMATSGLFNNIIFDTFVDARESSWPYRKLPMTSVFSAPATIFQVTCGLVDDEMIRQNGIGTGEIWNLTVDILNGTSAPHQGADASITWLRK